MINRIFPFFVVLALLLIAPDSQAQYQLFNPGFESWDGTSSSACPSHWSSFPQADGSWAWAASTAQHYHRNGGRPGTSGSSYLTIYSRSVLGVVANGNMTTGQIHAGSTSASSSNNYNYTHRGSSYCHTFRGTPDSMYVWVSYYAADASSEGSVRAYLHGDSDFRDPNDCSTTSLSSGKAVAQFSRTTTSATTPTWVQQRVPFVYDGTSSVNYVLMSMTTNTTPGGGSANDSLSVDDIEFVYSAWLDGLSINGNAIAGFQRDIFDYADSLSDVVALQTATVSYTTQASDAVVAVDTLVPDSLTRQFVLHVLAEDSVTTHTYTVTLSCPASTPDTTDTLAVIPCTQMGSTAFRIYPNPAQGVVWYSLQEQDHSTGLLAVFDNMGRKLLEQPLNTTTQHIDISTLPQGFYTVMVQSASGVAVQRLSVVR